MKFHYFSYLLIFSGMLSFFLAAQAFRFRRTAGARPFAGLMVCVSVYCIGYALELLSQTAETAVLCSRLQYLGIPFLPYFSYMLMTEFISRTPTEHWRTKAVQLAVPLATFVIVQTENLHSLYHINPHLSEAAPHRLVFGFGPWYMIFTVYLNFILLVIVVNYLMYFSHNARKYGMQALIMVIGSVLPWFGNVIYLLKIVPGNIDFSPIALSVSAPVFAMGLFRYKMFDLSPIARDYIFENYSEAIAVFDSDNRLVDFNASLAVVIPEKKISLGADAESVLSSYPELIQVITSSKPSRTTVSLEEEDITHYFYVTGRPLTSRRGWRIGTMYTFRNITEYALETEKLRRIASTDELTGMYNRRFFLQAGASEIKRADRYSRPMSLMMFDIDHFKHINDTFGHAAGDAVLKHISGIVLSKIREADIAGRYGGEEFLILLPETSVQEGTGAAEKIRRAFSEKPLQLEHGTVEITASFGVVGRNCDSTIESMIKDADGAMYRAKQNGRNRVEA